MREPHAAATGCEQTLHRADSAFVLAERPLVVRGRASCSVPERGQRRVGKLVCAR